MGRDSWSVRDATQYDKYEMQDLFVLILIDWLMAYAFYILLSCVMHHFEHKVDKCIHSTANLFMQDTQKHDTPTPKKEIKYFPWDGN